ncbi:lipopolysaccharide assembly LapA domain-containing protein [Bacillus sp. 03113]|uniref:LapA family protein n=1 Tax=Bacillus sp. 03113 TaxID=2578211 RepID=UPI0011414F5C|nr:lipopolysaccharide assembly protein LapA domain-containing protein [Bacillus sp. 03113]
MKGQINLIIALLFAIVIALFSILNGNTVKFNYLFGTAQWPLVLIILGSALIGGLAIASFGFVRIIRMRNTISQLKKELDQKNKQIEQLDTDAYLDGKVNVQNTEV